MNKTDLITNEIITKTVFKASRMLETQRWQEVNRAFICKSIAELMHELLITPVILKSDNGVTWFELTTDKTNSTYRFSGVQKAMDYWVIDSGSIKKQETDLEIPELNAADFFIELQRTIGITPENLTRFLEEVYKGLYADCFISSNRLPADMLADSSYQQIEEQMDGHPWLIMNKGRIGFSYTDYTRYSPEAGSAVRLLWLAVSKSASTFNCMDHLSYEELISIELDEEATSHFHETLLLSGLNPSAYFYMPVHEWQWNNKLIFMFAHEIAIKNIVPITYSDDNYFAQQSIRTFFNATHPEKHYVKTSLSILNTTLYRGLSPNKLKVAPRMAHWVSGIIWHDAYLKNSGFVLLNEVATLSYTHPQFKQITGVPYQYNEMLGVIWRESVMKHTNENEKPITMASLLYVDEHKKTLVSSFIEKSGLNTEQWVKAYLEAYFKPLIHCFYRHQMFFCPHGENVILLLNNYTPARMVLKDFVEEVQLAPEAYQAAAPEIQEVLYKIPEEDVTLFIFTDIFDGFFRYFSSLLSAHLNYDEQFFWKQVADVIHAYQAMFPDLKARYEKYDLFAPDFKRFCLNRFRLVTSGYQESAGIPAVSPIAGILENPIARYKK